MEGVVQTMDGRAVGSRLPDTVPPPLHFQLGPMGRRSTKKKLLNCAQSPLVLCSPFFAKRAREGGGGSHICGARLPLSPRFTPLSLCRTRSKLVCSCRVGRELCDPINRPRAPWGLTSRRQLIRSLLRWGEFLFLPFTPQTSEKKAASGPVDALLLFVFFFFYVLGISPPPSSPGARAAVFPFCLSLHFANWT